jgi:hypothetical protein
MNPANLSTSLISISISGIGPGYVVSAFMLGDDGKPDYNQRVYCGDFKDGSLAADVYYRLCDEWRKKEAA